MLAIVHARRDNLYYGLGQSLRLAGAPSLAAAGLPADPGMPGNVVAALEQAATRALEKRTPREIERQQLATESAASWSLLLASTKKEDGVLVVVPAGLGTKFEAAINNSGPAAAHSNLQKLHRLATANAEAKTHWMDTKVEMDADTLSLAHANCVRLFDFVDGPLNVSSTAGNTKVCLFNFCAPTAASFDFQEFKAHNAAVHKTLIDGGEEEPAALVASKLYLGGRLRTVLDVVVALAGYRAVLKEYMLDPAAFDKSHLWKLLSPSIDLLDSRDGKMWGSVVAAAKSPSLVDAVK